MAGARTVMIGSRGKMGVPSGTAQTSPVKWKLRRYCRNSSLNMFLPRRYAMSSSSKCSCWIYSTACSSPAAMAKPPLSGTVRKKMSK